MKVVEKDRVISGMLGDELNRCQEILHGLEKSLSELPKGVIRERKKRYKDKVYLYHCLKYRDGEKVINRHLASKDVPKVSKKLEEREKIEKEIRACKKRIPYLNKIMRMDEKGSIQTTVKR